LLIKWNRANAISSGFFLLCAALLYLRRPNQFTRPGVWNEESVFFLHQLESGMLSVFKPIAGYIAFVPKFIHGIALHLSFTNFPWIASILTFGFLLTILFLISKAPTLFHAPRLAALLLLLIPSDSECFMVSLYTLWWAGLLVILTLVWQTEKKAELLRYSLLTLGALSSPLIIGLIPLFWMRWLYTRSAHDFKFNVYSTLLATFQFWIYQTTNTWKPVHAQIDNEYIKEFLRKFVGYYFQSNSGADFFKILFLVLFITSLVRAFQKKHLLVILLSGAWIITAVLSSIRLGGPHLIDPLNAGPRYFFYPYILMGWLLLSFWPHSHALKKSLVALLLVAGVYNALPILKRKHDKLEWKEAIETCLSSSPEATHRIPVHFAGDKNHLWHLELTGSQCRKLAEMALFP